VDSLGAGGITTLLKTYDFSASKVKLISSVPGTHRNQQLNNYGHLKLRALLRECKWPSDKKDSEDIDKPSFLDYQVSYIEFVFNKARLLHSGLCAKNGL
jgi:hypothetical protein